MGCRTHLGVSWSALGASWKGLGRLLGSSWGHLGDIWELFGRYVGAWRVYLKRIIEILKNHQKQCKVLQKSRFGGSEIDGKISLEGELRQLLMLSWLVRGQVGAKRGKLMSTWRLRGTKLELKGVLGAPKEAPRDPKRATDIIGVRPRGVIFWPGGPRKVT